MNKRKILTITLIFITIIQSYGQLIGYYTIGGSGADYQTLALGLTDLYSQGISGDVVFALNAGTHSGATFTEIPGASDSSRFTLQSATLDSTDVNFNQTIGFNEASHITLKAITITAVNTRGIDFLKSNHIIIENCRINSSGGNSYHTEPINIEHYNSGGFSSIIISNCIVNSARPCISCDGPFGTTTVDNCTLNSTEWVSIEGDMPLGVQMYITNSILNGGIDVRLKNHVGILKGNEINGDVCIGFLDSVMYNTFTGNFPTRISSKYFEGNTFASAGCGSGCQVGSNSGSTFVNNNFECSISIADATDIIMIGNIFHENVHLSFNKNLLFANNTVYKQFYYGDSYTGNWNYRIYNNLIIGGHILARGHNSIISYNNFIDSAYLYAEYADLMVYDNNFCQGIRGNPSPSNVVHNNYFPLIYCYYDTASIHYDPIYDTANIGIATNPLLQGKGQSEAPIVDFVRNQRKSLPSVGANEIFICSDSLNNILTIPCGEELFLNLCNAPDTGNFWWTPDSCVMHSDSLYTSIHALNDLTLYLNNSVYGLVDSVTIQTETFQVEIATMPQFYCGYPMTLNATYHPLASYHWTPEAGLSNPFIRNPLLLLEDTTNLQYVLECNIDSCGTSYDTINIDYDPLPIVGIYYPEQIADTVFFNCLSTCANEYLWEFGDGTFSNEENPAHIYEENDTYMITLTGTNEYGSRSSTVFYDFYYVSEPYFEENPEIQLFPNPANNTLIINRLPYKRLSIINVVDLSGNNVLSLNNIYESIVKINTSDFKAGVYLISIMNQDIIINEKVVIIH